MLPIPVNIYFEIAAFVISLFCYSRIRDKPLKWFVPFLLFIGLVELTGRYIRKELHLPNSWLYNISIPVEYLFYTYLFYQHYHDPFLKRTAKVFLAAIPIAAILNILFIQGFFNLDTNILITGSCIMILLSCAYLIDLFKREEEIDLLREPMFWITTGVLFFNLGELSYNMFFDYIIRHKHDQRAVIFTSINSKVIYVLYTFISIALLCTKKRSRKT